MPSNQAKQFPINPPWQDATLFDVLLAAALDGAYRYVLDRLEEDGIPSHTTEEQIAKRAAEIAHMALRERVRYIGIDFDLG